MKLEASIQARNTIRQQQAAAAAGMPQPVSQMIDRGEAFDTNNSHSTCSPLSSMDLANKVSSLATLASVEWLSLLNPVW